LRALPDLSGPSYEETIKQKPELLGSLWAFYQDQFESDRFTVRLHIEELEHEIGVELPMGDAFDSMLDAMASTLLEITRKSWGSRTERVRSAAQAIQSELLALQRSKNNAKWTRIASQRAAVSRLKDDDSGAPKRNPDQSGIKKAEALDEFVAPLPWPDIPPREWPTDDPIYFTAAEYTSCDREDRAGQYNMYWTLQKQMQNDISIIIAKLALTRYSGPTEGASKIELEKKSMISKWHALRRITTNMRAYSVWRALRAEDDVKLR